jgi:WXXGXW repeat (2 copies)
MLVATGYLQESPVMTPRVALALVVALIAIGPAPARAGIFISVGIAPPPLVVYAQPAMPAPGYMWTPGYWAYSDDGYFWVPGTWIMAPFQGALWTPGFWGFSGGQYLWRQGYWGTSVGYYGGVNYGYGYGGIGFGGGRWQGGAFSYNSSVTNINTTVVHNTYNETVVVAPGANRTSFNGGPGGTTVAPTAAEKAQMSAQHMPPVAAQTQHLQAASTNRALFASVNHGSPAIAATARAGDFSPAHSVPARGTGPAAAPVAPRISTAHAAVPQAAGAQPGYRAPVARAPSYNPAPGYGRPPGAPAGAPAGHPPAAAPRAPAAHPQAPPPNHKPQ